MNTNKTYHVFTTSPVPFPHDLYQAPDRDEQNLPRFRHILQARLTENECRRVFGDNISITRVMCRESYDSHGFTIRIFASDVLACESSRTSHQGELINALRRQAGQEPLDHPQMLALARSYDDIRPGALQAILDAAADNPDPGEMDTDRVVAQMTALGLTLSDLIRNAPQSA